jgi:hypothetical protein
MLPRHTGTPRRHQRVPSHTQAPSEEDETATMEGKRMLLLYTVKVATGPGGSQPVTLVSDLASLTRLVGSSILGGSVGLLSEFHYEVSGPTA